MRVLFFMVFFLVIGCKETNKKQPIKFTSSGNINNLLVVVDNELWSGRVGDAIRDYIGGEIYGLPQVEPHFDLRQVPDEVFSDFVRRNRIVLRVRLAEDNNVKYYTDPYATPQKMAVVSGRSREELIQQIEQNASTIISTIKATEFIERQRRINKSLFNANPIEDILNITVRFPSAYRIAKSDENFFWIRRDTKTGSLNLLLYSLPFQKFDSTASFSEFVISARDSIAKQYIPGPIEGNYMQTETAYTPFFVETNLSGQTALETRSLWNVEGAFMSGPFVNYCFIEEANQRLFVAEGFVYSPSQRKRDYMFELETIIRSISFK